MFAKVFKKFYFLNRSPALSFLSYSYMGEMIEVGKKSKKFIKTENNKIVRVYTFSLIRSKIRQLSKKTQMNFFELLFETTKMVFTKQLCSRLFCCY